MLGLAEMSDPAVKYRLDKAVEFLDAVMACQLADQAPGAAVRWIGRSLRACDGSCFCEPGSKTASWRLHAVYDFGRGGFSHFELTDKHGAEAIERGAPVWGEIRIGNRNFARAPSLHRFHKQSANQADFIVRVGWNAFSLTRQDGSDFDLSAATEKDAPSGWLASPPSWSAIIPISLSLSAGMSCLRPRARPPVFRSSLSPVAIRFARGWSPA